MVTAQLVDFVHDGVERGTAVIVRGVATRCQIAAAQQPLQRDTAATQPAARIGFFVPGSFGHDGVTLSLNGKPAAGEWKDGFLTLALPADAATLDLALSVQIPLRAEPPHSVSTPKDRITLHHGILVLGTPDNQKLPAVRVEDLQPLGHGRYQVKDTQTILEPLSQMPFSSATAAAPWRTQFLFTTRP